MKNKKRLTATILIVIASLLSFTALHAAAAEEPADTETVAVNAPCEVATADGVGNYEGADNGIASAIDTEYTPCNDNLDSAEIAADENVFTELYNGAIANMDKILSLLAFIASLFVGIIYKKRLIPTLSVGINKIGESMNSFKEGVGGEEAERVRALDAMREELSSLENSTRIVSEELDEILARLGELLPKRAAEERTRIIMSAQVDLLYDVFMSSALPEYLKDEVGRRITEMREELNKENEETA